ncbi:acyltransferase [Clostridium perfringens]|uniref:acyltransferase n=1 Tax=Clostridium perfringens TaxID=1502 RepID=UPI0039E7C5FB
MKLIEYFIRKIKGNNFNIDKRIGLNYLFMMIFSLIINIIRGNIKTLFTKKGNLVVFIGSKSKIRMKKKVCLGKGINIGNNVLIDALSTTGVNIGDNVKIGDYTRILCTGSIKNMGKGFKIGNNCGIGEYCFFGAAGGIEIGNDVIMGQNVRFHSENHNYDLLDIPIRIQGVNNKGIKVGNDCWIGSGVVILDGVSIGDGCVIGANTLVSKDIPSYSIAVGNPAKVIKKRDDINKKEK